MADTTKYPKKSRLRRIPAKKGEAQKKAAGKPGLYGIKPRPKPKATTAKKKPATKPATKPGKKSRLRYIPRSK